MRLIDADALIEEYPQASGLKLVVENAPTAYDVDAVIAELCKEANDTTVDFCNGVFVNVESVIDIVRKGGVE